MNKKVIFDFVSLPDIFSIANGVLGFISLYYILIGNILLSSRIVFLCIFFDSFDGFLARRNDSCADFGKSLDSLSDIISFGIVPSFIFISYGNNNILGLVVGAIYLIFGLLRLSRFNAINSEEYYGLPITIGAIFVILIFFAEMEFYIYLILVLLTSILFISNFKIKRPSKNGKTLVLFSTIFVIVSLIPYPEIIIVSRLLIIILSSLFLIYLFKVHRF
ncbi:MAG: Archaetidylserine synthase [Candidatus Methanofastidiosum methylothiophilum]|uniref:CDP-diacylglycerol--serine O-phosphatidyltransferase n=1 Tax=Candidatus Methanofastidiosum methylothiophilum TaxID=1705564 RepID=A0A150J1A1_9EURY|nr:MAG: Archaetidylserine synthase [Candidatus Methanofastidiosum methylthiophilus]KYC48024.1 MAG: Archaetidylserine synthase [Candidatus Methanofastidiosum methylthiophilus]KYC50714.1 MAG: Archaetidylserine synthase [Candidatus Methanofastidiosum methylthiophilus]